MTLITYNSINDTGGLILFFGGLMFGGSLSAPLPYLLFQPVETVAGMIEKISDARTKVAQIRGRVVQVHPVFQAVPPAKGQMITGPAIGVQI